MGKGEHGNVSIVLAEQAKSKHWGKAEIHSIQTTLIFLGRYSIFPEPSLTGGSYKITFSEMSLSALEQL